MSHDPREAASALTELLEDEGRLIYGLGLRICGNPADAEDLVQETFLRAFRHWEQFEGRSKARTWLYTIARRACQRMHRKRAGEPARMETLDELLPRAEDSVADAARLEDGPFRDLAVREIEDLVEAGLAELPVDFRMPLVLVDIAEFSIPEAARILGLKPNTVKTRVYRARLKLRRLINGRLPQLKGGHRTHPRTACLDLLRARMEALDRGVDFEYSNEELCDRCRGVFATLEIGREVCRAIGREELSEELQKKIQRELKS